MFTLPFYVSEILPGTQIGVEMFNRPIAVLPFIAAVFVVSTVLNCFAATAVLTLEDLLPLALKNNPQLDIALQQFRQSEGRETQAKSGYLPRLKVGASLGRVYVDNLQPTDEDDVINGGVSASQLIYDFGKTVGGIDSARFSKEATRANLEQQLHDVVLLVKQAYYTVLENKALVVVAEQAVNNYEQHLYRAKKYFEAGVRTKIDIINAELELANAKLNLLRKRSDLKTSRVQLEQLLGIKPNSGDYQVATIHSDISTLAGSVPENSYNLKALLSDALKDRPGFRQLEQLVAAAEATVKSVQGENWPQLSAQGSYDVYETDISSLADQWQVAAMLSWEIFSGFETQGKLVEARANMLEISASKHELELAIIQEVTDSYLRAEENREAVVIADLAAGLAKRNLELAEGRYQAGLGDMIEFNDAQLNYTSSQSDLISTYFAYLTAIAGLERAAGINPGLPENSITEIMNR